VTTVKRYSAGWLAVLGAIALSILAGHKPYGFAPFGVSSLLWLNAGYRILAAPGEWPTFVRYWGWIMRPWRVDRESTRARWLFGAGTIFIALLLLPYGLAGALAALGYPGLYDSLFGSSA
jgi:hypothetical protein